MKRIIFSFFIICLFSCSPEDPLAASTAGAEIRMIGKIDLPAEVNSNLYRTISIDNDMVLTTEANYQIKHLGNFYTCADAAKVPGAVISGKNLIQNGDFSLYPIQPEQVTIFISSLHGVATEPVTIRAPRSSSLNFALQGLLQNLLLAGYTRPASFSYEMFVATSESHLRQQMKIYGDSDFFSAAWSTFVSASSSSTRLCFRFISKFATVECDPIYPESFHGNAPSVDDPPVYVNSATYGSFVLLNVVSTRSESEIRNSFAFIVDGANLFAAGVDAESMSRTIISECRIELISIGHAGALTAVEISGISALKSVIEACRNTKYDGLNPPALLSVQTRYVVDNTIARVASIADWTINTADKITKLSVEKIFWHCTSGSEPFSYESETHVFVSSPKSEEIKNHLLSNIALSQSVWDNRSFYFTCLPNNIVETSNGYYLVFRESLQRTIYKYQYTGYSMRVKIATSLQFFGRQEAIDTTTVLSKSDMKLDVVY